MQLWNDAHWYCSIIQPICQIPMTPSDKFDSLLIGFVNITQLIQQFGPLQIKLVCHMIFKIEKGKPNSIQNIPATLFFFNFGPKRTCFINGFEWRDLETQEWKQIWYCSGQQILGKTKTPQVKCSQSCFAKWVPEIIWLDMELKIYPAFNVFNALPKMKYHSVLSPQTFARAHKTFHECHSSTLTTNNTPLLDQLWPKWSFTLEVLAKLVASSKVSN